MGREPAPQSTGPHVFVTGLARSGTTVLMRALFESGQFCSLTYRDMPFVLAPGLWSRIAGRAEREATQRAHGDGVMVDFDSPEAFDEVFWRIFCGADYIRADRLLPMHADAATIEKFRRYVALIQRRHDRGRYLSKNNNNVLRLASIVEAFPAARILVPFREPLQQSYSLLNQHRRFLARDRNDKFAVRYMRWLVHHEFGADHRPFEWGLSVAQGRSPDTLDYWLAQWVGVYEQVLRAVEQHRENARLVSYELLCSQPELHWRRIADFVELSAATPGGFRMSHSEAMGSVDADLQRRAQCVHQELLAAACRVDRQ